MDNSTRTALVVPAETARRNELSRWLRDEVAKRGISKLGVTRGYLVRMAEDLDLTNEDLDLILSARKDFSASIPKICSMIRKGGVTAEDCFDLYRVRDSVMGQYEGKGSLSLAGILRFTEVFPSAALDDDELGEKLVEVFTHVNGQFRWIQYIDTAIGTVCEAAEYFGASDVDAVLDAMDGDWNLGQDGSAVWDDDDLLPEQG